MDKVKIQFKRFWNWLKSFFQTDTRSQYHSTLNTVIRMIAHMSLKILVQKEKHLKFKDEHGKMIDYKSAIGLNYIIEEL